MVQSVAKELINVISVVPRLREHRSLTAFVQGTKDKSSSSSGKEKTTSSSSGKGAKLPGGPSSTSSSSHTSKSTPVTASTPLSSNKSIPSFYEVCNWHFLVAYNRITPLFDNTSMNYRVSLSGVTALIKRWLFLNAITRVFSLLGLPSPLVSTT